VSAGRRPESSELLASKTRPAGREVDPGPKLMTTTTGPRRKARHPGADENGQVKYPNVNVLMEMGDMREANRSYEANLQMMKQSRAMVMMTVDLLRSS